VALGISGLWGIYGAIYFLRSSKAKGKAVCSPQKSCRSSQLNPNRNHWVESLLDLSSRETRNREPPSGF
jgi:hypothetical protein